MGAVPPRDAPVMSRFFLAPSSPYAATAIDQIIAHLVEGRTKPQLGEVPLCFLVGKSIVENISKVLQNLEDSNDREGITLVASHQGGSKSPANTRSVHICPEAVRKCLLRIVDAEFDTLELEDSNVADSLVNYSGLEETMSYV